jgi:ribosomal protein S27AE
LRRLLALGLGFTLIGVELATRGVSTVLGRLAGGLGDSLLGAEDAVSPFRYLTGLLFLAGGVAFLLILWWAGYHQRDIEVVGKACPRCGGTTTRISRSAVHRVLARVTRRPLTNRRCGRCGWSGLAEV